MSKVKEIPEALVYEMVEGNPIYYRGYEQVLSGEKQPEGVMGSRYLQAIIISELSYLLRHFLDSSLFKVLWSEVGLLFGPNSWRAVDIAIFEQATLKDTPKESKYLTQPPKVVIEVDTKANINAPESIGDYFQTKTDQLLNFGVEKIIWIFTENQKVMVAENGKDWILSNWSKDIQIVEDLTVNIEEIVAAA